MKVEKDLEYFLTNIVKLRPLEVLGLFKILEVEFYKEEELIDFGELLEDAIEKFEHAPKRQRRKINSLIKKIIKETEEFNGTEN